MRLFTRFRVYFIIAGLGVFLAIIAIEDLICRSAGLCAFVSRASGIVFFPVTGFFNLFSFRLEQMHYVIPLAYATMLIYLLLLQYVLSIAIERLVK